MNCVKCKSELVLREGKFGKFFACPKSNPSDNHGTVSTTKPRSSAQVFSYASSSPVNLDTLIQQQMMKFGGGRMSDLDLFVEESPEYADLDGDHWSNTRPY